MSKITNDSLTRSGTGCFIAVATVGVKRHIMMLVRWHRRPCVGEWQVWHDSSSSLQTCGTRWWRCLVGRTGRRLSTTATRRLPTWTGDCQQWRERCRERKPHVTSSVDTRQLSTSCEFIYLQRTRDISEYRTNYRIVVPGPGLQVLDPDLDVLWRSWHHRLVLCEYSKFRIE